MFNGQKSGKVMIFTGCVRVAISVGIETYPSQRPSTRPSSNPLHFVLPLSSDHWHCEIYVSSTRNLGRADTEIDALDGLFVASAASWAEVGSQGSRSWYWYSVRPWNNKVGAFLTTFLLLFLFFFFSSSLPPFLACVPNSRTNSTQSHVCNVYPVCASICDITLTPFCYTFRSPFRTWHFLFKGPLNTPYEGGSYWGRLEFPTTYPVNPPAVFFVTPSGE